MRRICISALALSALSGSAYAQFSPEHLLTLCAERADLCRAATGGAGFSSGSRPGDEWLRAATRPVHAGATADGACRLRAAAAAERRRSLRGSVRPSERVSAGDARLSDRSAGWRAAGLRAVGPGRYGERKLSDRSEIRSPDRRLSRRRSRRARSSSIRRTNFSIWSSGGGKALRYGIGVGRPGFTWAGVKTITAKKEWPDWRPPAEMLAAPARSAALHARRHRQSARRARDVSRLDALSHPRLQRALDHRHQRVVRLHPHAQRGRRRISTIASRSAPRSW